jgi:hypothetical protein
MCRDPELVTSQATALFHNRLIRMNEIKIS